MPRFLQPVTLEEAFASLAGKQDLRLLAGGSDVLVLKKQGLLADCAWLMDIKRIPETQVFDVQGGMLRIGAAITCNQVMESPLVTPSLGILQQAAASLANTLVRNRATLVGNLCNASPGADMAGACLVLGATLVAAGPAGQRRIALRDFFTGVKRQALEPGEIALWVEVPLVEGRGIYLKKRRIHGHDLAQVGVSGFYSAEHELRLALGSVATTPLLLDGFGVITPAELVSQREELVETAVAAARPITDIRATKDYRLAMVRHLTGRILDAFATGKEASDV